MKTVERIVIVLILLIIFSAAAWIFFAVKNERAEIREAVARGEYQIPLESEDKEVVPEDWKSIYPNTVSITIGTSTIVKASVADSLPERIKGLSDTPFLPDDVIKFFDFEINGNHSIWMKDMNYALDVLWLTEDGEIVHIKEDISPDTYPKSFSSPVESWYLIEANSGFVAEKGISLGDKVDLSKI